MSMMGEHSRRVSSAVELGFVDGNWSQRSNGVGARVCVESFEGTSLYVTPVEIAGNSCLRRSRMGRETKTVNGCVQPLRASQT